MALPKDFSEATAKLIDDEVRRIITDKEKEITGLFEQHQKDLIVLSDALIGNETMYADEIKSLLNL